MKVYFTIFHAYMKTLLQYRIAAFAGIVTQVFWGILLIIIYKAFCASSPGSAPMSIQDFIIYTWLVQATFRLIPFGIDTEIQQMMSKGVIGFELVRPVSLLHLWMARYLAKRLAPTLLRFFPTMIISLLFLGMKLPVSISGCIGWFVSLFLALWLSAVISLLMSLTLFWTISGEGISHMMTVLIYSTSGQILPLQIFPDHIAFILRLLPFSGMVDLPNRYYIGTLSLSQLPMTVLFQLSWIFILLGVCQVLYNKSTKKIVIQGG